MANHLTQFIDPAGLYTGGYTSNMIEANFKNSSSNATRGVVQADVEVGATVSLQMRVAVAARWVQVALYTEDSIEEVVMGNFMRVVVTGDAKAWLGETK